MQTVECDECGCCVERKHECPVCSAPLPKAAQTARVRGESAIHADARAWVSGLTLLMATGLAVRHHVVLVMICMAMLVAGVVSFFTSLHDHGSSR